MATREIILKLNKLIEENLGLNSISSLSDEEFKKNMCFFFKKVDELRNEGLKIDNELKQFLDGKYYDMSIEFLDDKVTVYEERIQDIFTELMGDCPNPQFWAVSLDEYLKRKWRYN